MKCIIQRSEIVYASEILFFESHCSIKYLSGDLREVAPLVGRVRSVGRLSVVEGGKRQRNSRVHSHRILYSNWIVSSAVIE